MVAQRRMLWQRLWEPVRGSLLKFCMPILTLLVSLLEPNNLHDVQKSVLDGCKLDFHFLCFASTRMGIQLARTSTAKIISVFVAMLEDSFYSPVAIVLLELISDRAFLLPQNFPLLLTI